MNKPVLMVVDDDPQVLAAVRRDMRNNYREGYTIVAASSGEEALETMATFKASGESLAMVITDQRMPGIQGNDVLARTREVYPFARRVLLTAYADTNAAIKAINEAHVDHYLMKPWDPPEELLYPVVDELLREWQAEYRPDTTGLRLVGHQWSPRSHRIKDFLSSNLIPYHWLEMLMNAEAKALVEASGIASHELPALFLEDGTILRDPEPRQIAERLGRSLSASSNLYDLVIVGAGPAGLAGAVYGASEGLKTLLLDRHAPGGQAGTSSRIENYLGFPSGVSGSELTRRARDQAIRLGAELLVPLEVCGVTVDAGYKRVALADGREIVTRTLMAATGMAYREHPADGIAQFTGAGVYYGAATTEAPAFRDKHVYVIGGGNSAGQAAMYLARYAADVHIVIRRPSLRETMSAYLIEQIEKTANIRVRSCTELDRVEGGEHVERVTLKSAKDDQQSVEDADAVFVFIGTQPRSDWLPPSVLLDSKGFVLTGRELTAAGGYQRTWKEPRQPFLLETSTPGIFAAGDLRAGAMNRVAAAVGEGSMVVRFVHEYLAIS